MNRQETIEASLIVAVDGTFHDTRTFIYSGNCRLSIKSFSFHHKIITHHHNVAYERFLPALLLDKNRRNDLSDNEKYNY